MIRRVGVIAAIALSAVVLTGCGADAGRPAIFDREQTAQDAVPVTTAVALDGSSTRYVGADSDGDQYWVGRPVGRPWSSLCVVYEPAVLTASGWTVSCGGLPLSTTTPTGKTIEFAIAPVSLDSGNSEVVGNTLLVRDSTPVVSG